MSVNSTYFKKLKLIFSVDQTTEPEDHQDNIEILDETNDFYVSKDNIDEETDVKSDTNIPSMFKLKKIKVFNVMSNISRFTSDLKQALFESAKTTP